MADCASDSIEGTVQGALSALRATTAHALPDTDIEFHERLDVLDQQVQNIVTEHTGMADELLRAYEQLGIVFEVTRQLPTLHDEEAVLQLFTKSLRVTYPHTRIAVVKCAGTADSLNFDGDVPRHDWIVEAVEESITTRRLIVKDCPESRIEGDLPHCNHCAHPCSDEPPVLRLISGPVYAGDSLVVVLLLTHGPSDTKSGSFRPFEASDMSLLESLTAFCGDMIRNFRLVAELRNLSVNVVEALTNAIEQKDEYTSGHTSRVAIYAVMLGRAVGLDAQELQMLEWSALLHDVGKIGIRDAVLKKEGKLTDEEFEHIKEHPVRSYEVVREIPQLADALDGVMHHHEKWNGKGYPSGLAGQDIPRQARIVQVADIFDALTSNRSYRRAFDWPKALEIIAEEAGSTIDPELATIFTGLIRNLAENEPDHFKRIQVASRIDKGSTLGAPVNATRSHQCGRNPG